MNYEIIKQKFMGIIYESVLVDLGDGSFESFPVDEGNPRYQQFLEES